jgi:hypothetical protein
VNPIAGLSASANIVAYLALILWLPFALLIFSTFRPQLAVLLIVVGGILFLPEVLTFDFPLVPPLEKNAIANLSALVGLLITSRRLLTRSKPFRGIGLLVLLLLLSTTATIFTNTDVIRIGKTELPRLQYNEIIPSCVRDFLTLGLPFILGRSVFRTSKDLRELFYVLSIFGLIYSVLALVEMRMSPQLHIWIYGYHQHSFLQSIRWGGYRPTVFLAHGLAVGLFMLIATMGIFSYARAKPALASVPTKVWGLYMIVVFIFCKSTGAVFFGLFSIPAAIFLKAKSQVRLAVILGIAFAIYPFAKVTGLFPEEKLVNFALDISADRADSLQDRFDNDLMLSNRARERILFGWGPYGRARVYDSDGNDISVTDGWWIINLGNRGFIGLYCLLGLLILPIVGTTKKLPKVPDKKDRILIGGLTLICVFYALDLLLNGLYNTLPFFLSGALLGLSEQMSKMQRPMPMRGPMPMPMPMPQSVQSRPAGAL